jgi:signal transduction histidine kinase
VPITVGSAIWGVLAATSRTRPLPVGTERRLTQFADIAAAAVANAESRAQLTASRARVVATADDTRRRLQRDVHDGAQQRLVQTVISLKLALRALDGVEGPVAALVEESLRHAEDATTQLRDVVHGMLPASLDRGGLPSGIESLVSDLPLAVEAHVAPQRLPADVETTAYFVVAEALTNVVKHARARRARVRITVDDAAATVEILVEDDGIGGVRAERGSGLIGLSDRVAAKEGTLAVTSPPGGGTTLRVVLPTAAAATG